ncbi:Maf family protein [Acinetobacter rudis]|uniref:dTTP/UTP pyrophosphatase n=1 Tax=Acinetobacter rudis CIP 110305 TaxID=421052 RepID=S3MTP6_9GAMM|nr:Maf family nucleotide pyrophosphatase [Acinetobacter rudis]EPF70947.1 septum formation protein Maf [Acinetobacter rudis CIP 110305]
MANLILASGSARRRELLQQLGLDFHILSPDIDESLHNNESVADYVQRLAKQKAQAVLKQHAGAVVIAADTSVSISNQILGKPHDREHAFAMWSMLSGKTHEVYSGVCVASDTMLRSIVVKTEVEFQVLHQSDMQYYWNSGEPLGKAGAYAIQGIAAQYIPRIVGSYSNVVGLPLHETVQLLKEFDVLEL